MSTFKVRVLYDFQGEASTAELSLTAGDIITVTRTDVGEGWWEGLNPRGQSGLFPETYVEKIESSIPPPAPPVQVEWGLPGIENKISQSDTPGASEGDDSDDDKDEPVPGGNHNSQQIENAYYCTGTGSVPYKNYNKLVQYRQNSMDDNRGNIAKPSINIFSSAVKTGLERYILGQTKEIASTASKRINIFRDSDESLGRWEQISNPYTVQVASPKKATKLGGLKSFIAYQITPSFTNIEVSRRYKHFDWLHNRLTEKFNVIGIPPLPDKQVSGRYEDAFIEHRRVQLQEFTDYMCRHPVLSTCDVWVHFLTCIDDKQWKQGDEPAPERLPIVIQRYRLVGFHGFLPKDHHLWFKRQIQISCKRNAERDQLIGASFCLSVDAPEREIMSSIVEAKIDENVKYIEKMDGCIKNLMQTAQDQRKKCENMYKREFTRVGDAFYALGCAFEANQQGMYSKASVDVKSIGTTYIMIGKLYEEQGKIDWQPLFDKMYIYKGITSNLPDVLHMQRMSEQKKRECERTNQVQPSDLAEIRRRSDIMTYTVFAELNHFQQERDNDLKKTLKEFLKEQLNFYKNVVSKLEDTLNNFD